jgi:hypothetical protein
MWPESLAARFGDTRSGRFAKHPATAMEAVAAAEKSMRLNPRHPWFCLIQIGVAYLSVGRFNLRKRAPYSKRISRTSPTIQLPTCSWPLPMLSCVVRTTRGQTPRKFSGLALITLLLRGSRPIHSRILLSKSAGAPICGFMC